MSNITKTKYKNFIENNSYWLEDFALFAAIKKNTGKSWFEWDDDLKFKKKEAISNIKKTFKSDIEFQYFMQYKFFEQWKNLKAYANNNNIKIVGDIPLYVAYDSSDCWANPEVFMFDENRIPLFKAGVPPDYFSETGQLWGNPVFNWEYLKNTDYKWWLDRIHINSETADILRFDHFRGLAGFWAVPFNEKTAVNGKWLPAYGDELFYRALKLFPNTEMIAEDLGIITPDVEELRDKYNFKGMKILQFAFDSGNDSDFFPHNYTKNSIVYTGALDNNTIRGWYNNASLKDKAFMMEYLRTNEKDAVWDLIASAYASTSDYAVTTMQDLLELDSDSRMNTPGTALGNWVWRYKKSMLTDKITLKLQKITKLYGR